MDEWRNLPDRATTLRAHPDPNDPSTAPLFRELEKNSSTHLSKVEELVKDYNILSTKYAAVRNAMSVRMGAYHYTMKHAGHIPANVPMHQLLNKIVVVKPSMYIFEKVEKEGAYNGSVTQDTVNAGTGKVDGKQWTACIRNSFTDTKEVGTPLDVATGTNCTLGTPAMITFKDDLCAPAGTCPLDYRKLGGFTGVGGVDVPTGLRQCYSMYRYLNQGSGTRSQHTGELNWGYNTTHSQFVCPNIPDVLGDGVTLQKLKYDGNVVDNIDQSTRPMILGSDTTNHMNYMSHDYGPQTADGDEKVTFPDFKKKIETVTLTPISNLNLRKSINADERGEFKDSKNAQLREADGNLYIDLAYKPKSYPRNPADPAADQAADQAADREWVRGFVYLPGLMLVRSALESGSAIAKELDSDLIYKGEQSDDFDYLYFFSEKIYAVKFISGDIGKYLTPNDFLSQSDKLLVRLYMRIPGVRTISDTNTDGTQQIECYPRIHPNPNNTAVFDVGNLHRQMNLPDGDLKLVFKVSSKAVDSYTGGHACSSPDKIKELTDVAKATLTSLTEKSREIRTALRLLDEGGISSQMKDGSSTYRQNAKTYYELNKMLADAYQKLLTEQNELHVLDTSVDDMRRLGVSDRYKMIFYLIILVMFMSSVYFVYHQSA